jgi:peptide subunit release factor 1 (eRF1)
MFDRLLGRAELKERIEELAEEKRHLERRLDAEGERRSDAETARQEAERRVNRLEDRIADLEGRLERTGGEESSGPRPRGTESLHGDRLEEVLARLRSVATAPEGALTAMVGDTTPDAVRDTLGDRAAVVDDAAPCLVCVDDAGLVSAALDLPLPPDPFVEWGEAFRIEDGWFHPVGYTVALIRSDRFAVGRYDGTALRDVETVQSEVKSDHSKGGFSQSRFERRREEQVETHLERCRAVLDRRDPDRLVLLGERSILGRLDREAAAVDTVDASGDPEAALEDALRSFRTVRLVLP